MKTSREKMIRDLLEWNPNWNSQTVNDWSLSALSSVHIKEKKKLKNTNKNRTEMIDKLIEWDPSLNKTTLLGLNLSMLVKQYNDEQQAVVNDIFKKFGLPIH
jgi:hypothetical protein